MEPSKKASKSGTSKTRCENKLLGAISYNGSTSLHIYKESLKADRYEKILEENQEEMDASTLMDTFFNKISHQFMLHN